MHRFLVVLCEIDTEGEATDRRLQKLFERDERPHIDETLVVGGNGCKVISVEHELERECSDPRSFFVRAEVEAGDFATLMHEDPTWELKEGYEK